MAVVLVVEDEAHVLSLVLLVLDKLGHVAIAARTLPEAEVIIHSNEKFDLVFTDVALADHSQGGITIGLLMQEVRVGTPVLYTSGSGFTEEIRTLCPKPNGFLMKPYTAQALSHAIGNLLLAGDRDKK
jgi:DNA-binding NtrC family response regulator